MKNKSAMKIKYQRHPEIQIIKFFSQNLNLKISNQFFQIISVDYVDH